MKLNAAGGLLDGLLCQRSGMSPEGEENAGAANPVLARDPLSLPAARAPEFSLARWLGDAAELARRAIPETVLASNRLNRAENRRDLRFPSRHARQCGRFPATGKAAVGGRKAMALGCSQRSGMSLDGLRPSHLSSTDPGGITPRHGENEHRDTRPEAASHRTPRCGAPRGCRVSPVSLVDRTNARERGAGVLGYAGARCRRGDRLRVRRSRTFRLRSLLLRAAS